MKKTLNIDWLSIFGIEQVQDPVSAISPDSHKVTAETGSPLVPREYGIPLALQESPSLDWLEADYGTKQFERSGHIRNRITHDKLAHVQIRKRQGIKLDPAACIVKFANSSLYNIKLDEIVRNVMTEACIGFKNISRLDLALDFNYFHKNVYGEEQYNPEQFIRDYMEGRIRRVIRNSANGCVHFQQDAKTGCFQYSAIHFGSKSSEVNCYLYNKTKELEEVKDKPHIRQAWEEAGLDLTKDVWRLEFSLSSKALKFRDDDGVFYDFTTINTLDMKRCSDLFWSLVGHYFQFVNPHDGVTNTTRKKRIELFDEHCTINRRSLNLHYNTGIAEKIFLKRLYQLTRYPGMEMQMIWNAQDIANRITAYNPNLREWFERKREQWEKGEDVRPMY